ncbi:MAG: NUDIX domain-containing protein [Actinocatenispora sp.]
MTTRRPPGLRGLAHSVGYRVFYRLPGVLRRRIVRTVTPTYTLGAVTLVLDRNTVDADLPGHRTPPGARMLLLRQPPGFGWSLPGGLIERGEHPNRCAARELGEEAGISLPAEELCPAVPNAVVHPHGRWVDTVFVARVDPADNPLVVDGAEVFEAEWFALSDLPRLTLPTARLLARYGIGPLAETADDPDTAVPDTT